MNLVRRDRIHADVVAAYRRAGVQFRDVSHLAGLGCDLIPRHVRTGLPVFLELKDGALPPSRRRLTESEARLQAMFPDSFVVGLSVGEALRAVGLA